jgi:hypothetical protein
MSRTVICAHWLTSWFSILHLWGPIGEKKNIWIIDWFSMVDFPAEHIRSYIELIACLGCSQVRRPETREWSPKLPVCGSQKVRPGVWRDIPGTLMGFCRRRQVEGRKIQEDSGSCLDTSRSRKTPPIGGGANARPSACLRGSSYDCVLRAGGRCRKKGLGYWV